MKNLRFTFSQIIFRWLTGHSSILFFIGAMLAPSESLAGIFATYDPMAGAMVAPEVSPSILYEGDELQQLNHVIPRRIFLLTLCDSSDDKVWVTEWKAYAQKFSYDIVLINQNTITYWRHLFSSSLYRTLLLEKNAGRHEVAEKIIRWVALANYGGIAIEKTIWPPQHQRAMVDFDQLMPMEGLVCSVAHRPHNIRQGVSGIALDDIFIAAAPNHPVINRVIESLPNNLISLNTLSRYPNSDYTAGKALFTRSLGTPSTILPRHFFEEFNMMEPRP